MIEPIQDFRIHAWRFHFRALSSVVFPPGKAGNLFRGAFGTAFRRVACMPDCPGAVHCPRRSTCSYGRMFEPRLPTGPSGLSRPPLPFVLRAASLDGRSIPAGDVFHLDVHVFDMRDPAYDAFAAAFRLLTSEGLGPARGRIELHSIDTPPPVQIELEPSGIDVERLRVRFLTPTELKQDGRVLQSIPFAVLFARVRDRISTLRALYGDGPLAIDFRAVGERARNVGMLHSDLRTVDIERRSSRTGQIHGIGGLVGEVEYEGELSEFVPFLRAAYWTGVGRHTVWGNGVLDVEITAN